MAAQLPHGLIRVVSASHTELTSSDPADIIFERKQALYNFWKVHDAQSRAIQDASNIRCRQLFWRVWGSPRLSLSLSQNTMMQLWMQCQQDLDLSPFHLLITDGNAPSACGTASPLPTQLPTRRLSKQSQKSESSVSVSPTHMTSPRGASIDSTDVTLRSKRASSQHPGKPSLTRTASSNEPTRKRASITTTSRGKARPSMPRKKSSQSTQVPEPARPRKSIIKSPTSTTSGVEASESRRGSRVSIIGPLTQSPTSPDPTDHRISIFELPSASSWQSVDSHPDPFGNISRNVQAQEPSSLLVDKNFREKFVETQKQLRSSTNLVGLNRAMRKTGSVVRFADEVDRSEELQKLKGAIRPSPFAPRAASDGQQGITSEQPSSWKQPLPHRDSVGSVAAISDEDSDDTVPELPRTKSQLSMAIAHLKRSQSSGEASSLAKPAITSPQIEQEQEALISGAVTKKKTEEEEKLLAMAHKDGVTKAGGINMPKQMTVVGSAFEFGSSYDSPEEPIF